MSRELDLFEQIAEQSSFSFNKGERKDRRGARQGHWSVSPALERAKVARPPKNESTDSPSPPEAIPAEQPAPPVAHPEPPLIRDMAGIVEALKAACAERGITYSTLGDIAGVADRYVEKLFAHKPMKNLGYQSTGELLGAAGKALIMVDDPEAIDRVKDRWTPRKRPATHRPGDGALLNSVGAANVSSTEDTNAETSSELPTKTRACDRHQGESSGGATDAEPTDLKHS